MYRDEASSTDLHQLQNIFCMVSQCFMLVETTRTKGSKIIPENREKRETVGESAPRAGLWHRKLEEVQLRASQPHDLLPSDFLMLPNLCTGVISDY